MVVIVSVVRLVRMLLHRNRFYAREELLCRRCVLFGGGALPRPTRSKSKARAPFLSLFPLPAGRASDPFALTQSAKHRHAQVSAY